MRKDRACRCRKAGAGRSCRPWDRLRGEQVDGRNTRRIAAALPRAASDQGNNTRARSALVHGRPAWPQRRPGGYSESSPLRGGLGMPKGGKAKGKKADRKVSEIVSRTAGTFAANVRDMEGLRAAHCWIPLPCLSCVAGAGGCGSCRLGKGC